MNGFLVICLWIITLTAGVFFPPLFIAPIYATVRWMKMRQRRRA